jgi:hypothetical protein
VHVSISYGSAGYAPRRPTGKWPMTSIDGWKRSRASAGFRARHPRSVPTGKFDLSPVRPANVAVLATIPRWTLSATHLPRCTNPTPSTHSTSSKSDSLRAPFQSSWGNDVSQPLKPGSTCRPPEREPFASASPALGWKGATDGGITAQAWIHPDRLPSFDHNLHGMSGKAWTR